MLTREFTFFSLHFECIINAYIVGLNDPHTHIWLARARGPKRAKFASCLVALLAITIAIVCLCANAAKLLHFLTPTASS